MRSFPLKSFKIPALFAAVTVLSSTCLLAQNTPPAADKADPQAPQPVKVEAKQLNAKGSVNAPTQQPGKLKFAVTTKDMGKVSEGDKVEVLFEVENPTDQAIAFTNIQTSCGCTSPKDNPQNIAAGAKSQIRVVYDTTNKEGRHTRTVTVYTDEPGGAAYPLSFSAEAVAEVFLSEKMARFDEIVVGSTAGKRVDFISMTTPPTEIKAVTSPDSKLVLTKGEAVEYVHSDGRKGWRTPVTIEVPADYPVGPVSTMVSVATTHAKKSALQLSVSGVVVGNYKASPQRLMMGSTRPGDTKDLAVIVKSNSGKPFTIPKIELVDSVLKQPTDATKAIPLTLKVEDGPELDSKKVVATFNAPEQNGNFTADVHLTMDMEGQQERLTLPFRVFVRTPADTTKPPSAAAPGQINNAMAAKPKQVVQKKPAQGPPAPAKPAEPAKP